MRVGIGYDIHRLAKGRKLRLGGVAIPFSKGLVGHSDADVVLHAVVDAILGAMAEGDIGSHFSDRDSRYRGADSMTFVQKARETLQKKRFKIENIDCVIVAEEPRLGPFRGKIRRSIASGLGIRIGQVSVKAKTNEGLGPVGQKKAIVCFALAGIIKIGQR